MTSHSIYGLYQVGLIKLFIASGKGYPAQISSSNTYPCFPVRGVRTDSFKVHSFCGEYSCTPSALHLNREFPVCVITLKHLLSTLFANAADVDLLSFFNLLLIQCSFLLIH